MDNKEKFQLVIKFLDKLITEKSASSVNISDYGNLSVNYCKRYDDDKIRDEYYGVSSYNDSIRFWKSEEFGFTLKLDEIQSVEFKYKMNMLNDIYENKAIEYLKTI